MCCLTSSISWRETFLLSLFEADFEPESATGGSILWLFCCSLWESCETWVEDCSCALWNQKENSCQIFYKQIIYVIVFLSAKNYMRNEGPRTVLQCVTSKLSPWTWIQELLRGCLGHRSNWSFQKFWFFFFCFKFIYFLCFWIVLMC